MQIHAIAQTRVSGRTMYMDDKTCYLECFHLICFSSNDDKRTVFARWTNFRSDETPKSTAITTACFEYLPRQRFQPWSIWLATITFDYVWIMTNERLVTCSSIWAEIPYRYDIVIINNSRFVIALWLWSVVTSQGGSSVPDRKIDRHRCYECNLRN